MANYNDDDSHYGDGNHVDSQGPPPTCCWSRRRRRQRDFPRRHSQSKSLAPKSQLLINTEIENLFNEKNLRQT